MPQCVELSCHHLHQEEMTKITIMTMMMTGHPRSSWLLLLLLLLLAVLTGFCGGASDEGAEEETATTTTTMPAAPTAPTEAFLCRSRGKMLPPAAFRLETCAFCYFYMPANQVGLDYGTRIRGSMDKWIEPLSGSNLLKYQ